MYSIEVAPPNDDIILKGLQAGIYKITGGVVREVSSGRIVAHMREVGNISTETISSTAAPILPYLNLGVGLLTLSAVAASTFFISKQINKIGNSLEQLFEELKYLKRDVELVKAIEVFKDLKIALHFSEDFIKDRQLRQELLRDRLKAYRRAIATFDIFLNYALNNLFDGKNTKVIAKPLKLYILAYSGYCNTLLELEEIEQAYYEYNKAYKHIKQLFTGIVDEILPSYLKPLEFLKVDLERFWGYKKETETVKNLNLSFEAWKGLTKNIKKPGLYLIKFSEVTK